MHSHHDTPIRLFIAEATLLRFVAGAMGKLAYKNVSIVKVRSSFFEAVRQLFSELMNFEGLLLVCQPTKQIRDHTGAKYDDPCHKEFYEAVTGMLAHTRRNATEALSQCVPIFFAAQDHDIRGRILEDLFTHGITGAFMMQRPGIYGNQAQKLEQGARELDEYLEEFFRMRGKRLAELKEYASAEELSQRRAQAEKIMEQVEQFKAAGDLDKAIALCRQATEVLPTDPDAFLEGGRLMVKKRRYPPALQMFRDAEKVSEYLPAPNREIGNLRVAQIKDYLTVKASQGVKPDARVVAGYLQDAVESFKTALQKAESTSAVRRENQEERRRDAVAHVAENIFTLDLSGVLGADHPMVTELLRLATESLSKHMKGDNDMPAKYLVQFGLSRLSQGDFRGAEDFFSQAASDPPSFESACIKMNYLGTILRKKKRLDDSIRVYQRLLGLGPSFRAVVLFNLAVAWQTKAGDYQQNGRAGVEQLSRQALGHLVQAFFLEPNLPSDANFYQNTVLLPPLRRLLATLKTVAQMARKMNRPSPPQCKEAVCELEKMLSDKQQRQALDYMFRLARELKPFFLEFDKHGSEAVLRFAQAVQPRLNGHPNPNMRLFGKVLAVLVAKANQNWDDQMETGDQELDAIIALVLAGNQRQAAADMAVMLISRPQLAKQEKLLKNQTLVNLCRELDIKFRLVKLTRFNPTQAAAPLPKGRPASPAVPQARAASG